MATVKVGGRPATEVSGGPKIEDVKATSGALHVADQAVHPGEDATYDRTFGGGRASHSAAITADASVKGSAGIYYGFIVTATTATAAIDIRDATSAGTGTIIDTIPIGTAAGTRVNFATGITCTTGIYVDYGASATGTIIVAYL